MQLGARAQLQRPEVQTTCWSTHRRKRTWMRSWLWAAQDVGDWTTQYRRWKVHGVGLIPAETSAFGTVGPHPVLLLPGRFDAALAGWHMLGRAMLMRLTEMRSRRAFAPQSSRAKFLRPQDLPSLSRCGAKVRLPHRWPPATFPCVRSVGHTDGSSSHRKAKAGRSIAKWRSDPGNECRLENSED